MPNQSWMGLGKRGTSVGFHFFDWCYRNGHIDTKQIQTQLHEVPDRTEQFFPFFEASNDKQFRLYWRSIGRERNLGILDRCINTATGDIETVFEQNQTQHKVISNQSGPDTGADPEIVKAALTEMEDELWDVLIDCFTGDVIKTGSDITGLREIKVVEEEIDQYIPILSLSRGNSVGLLQVILTQLEVGGELYERGFSPDTICPVTIIPTNVEYIRPHKSERELTIEATRTLAQKLEESEIDCVLLYSSDGVAFNRHCTEKSRGIEEVFFKRNDIFENLSYDSLHKSLSLENAHDELRNISKSEPIANEALFSSLYPLFFTNQLQSNLLQEFDQEFIVPSHVGCDSWEEARQLAEVNESGDKSLTLATLSKYALYASCGPIYGDAVSRVVVIIHTNYSLPEQFADKIKDAMTALGLDKPEIQVKKAPDEVVSDNAAVQVWTYTGLEEASEIIETKYE